MNIGNSPSLEGDHHNDREEDSPAEKLNQAIDDERAKLRDVEFAPDRHDLVLAERNRLNQNLGEVSRLWTELYDTITEVQRGVGSLQYMIDPENN
jgi:hypothetical protein